MASRTTVFGRSVGVFLFLCAVLLPAYSPIIFQKFIFNDDNLMWLRPPGSPVTAHPQFRYFFVIGRPLFSLLAWPVWDLARSLTGLSVVRLLMVLLLAVSGVALHHWFRKAEAPRAVVWLLPPMLLLLPAVQTQVILANSFPHPICLLLSIAGAFQALKWTETGARGDFGKSLGLIFLSLCIYTPTTFAYAALVFIWLVFKKDARRTGKLLIPLLLAAVLYFVFALLSYNILKDVLKVHHAILGDHAVVPSLAVMDKAKLFLRLLLQSANLWNIGFAWPLALATFMIVLAGGVLAWVANRARFRTLCLYMGLAVTCLGVSVLPHMAATSNMYSFRSLTGMSWICLIAVAWALLRACDLAGRRAATWLSRAVMALMILTGGYQCFNNLNRHIVYPARREAEFIGKKLLAAQPSQQEFYFLPMGTRNYLWRRRGFRNLLFNDEYGFLSTAVPMNSAGLINCIIREYKITLPFRYVRMTAQRSEVPDAVLLIDMNDLLPEL